MWQQTICVSLADGRADLTGQRSANATQGTQKSRPAKGQISWPETHIRHGSPAKWGGYQDGLRDAGALQCRVHLGHLRPRHHPGKAGGGENHGQYPLQYSLTLSRRFPVWVKNREQKLISIKSDKKQK